MQGDQRGPRLSPEAQEYFENRPIMRGQAESVKDYFSKFSEPIEHRFSKRVHNEPRPHEFEGWDYLKHGNSNQWQCKGGLDETKFHKGFYRRHRSCTDGHEERQKTGREQEPFHSTQERREKLTFINRDVRNYDIISGLDRPATSDRVFRHKDFPSLDPTQRERKTGKRVFGDQKLTTHSQEITAFRYYQARPNTSSAKTRSTFLEKDGLPLTKKKSSLLGFGRGDLSSRGVADNFGNSYYLEQCKSVSTLENLLRKSK